MSMNKVEKYSYAQINTVEEVEIINTSIDRNKIKNIITKIVKRTIDIIASLIGLIMLIPLTIIIWIVNKVNKEDGPIFYSHIRIGKNGKPFKLHKFRTMCVDADEKLKKLLENDEKLKKEWEENRKLNNDPRITKIGKFLRATSIDEIPNFIAVFVGNMSLVGPRAVIPDELEMFGQYKEKILKVKPGITGFWAANGRSNTSYEERAKMEAYYAENNSILLDIKIIFKTIISVIKRDGAV